MIPSVKKKEKEAKIVCFTFLDRMSGTSVQVNTRADIFLTMGKQEARDFIYKEAIEKIVKQRFEELITCDYTVTVETRDITSLVAYELANLVLES